MFVGVLIAALLLVGAALLLAGLGRGTLEDEPVDAGDPGLPDRPLRSSDVTRLRFRVTLRGYRMDDVDTALDALADALAAAERRADAASSSASAAPR